MNFEDLKVVWDAQSEESVYAVDQTGLRKQVEQRYEEFNRSIFWRDVRETGIGLVVGFLLIFWSIQMIVFGGDWLSDLLKIEASIFDAGFLLFSGGVWLYYAGFRFVGRKRQEKREQQFDGSLKGDLQKACAQVDYQIWLSKNVLWWNTLPVALGTGLLMFVLAKPILINKWAKDPIQAGLFLGVVIVIMLISFVLDYRCKKQPIQEELLPRKRELESLQNKLMESDAQSV